MASELNLWFMDDAPLNGHLGLQLNFSECEVIMNDPNVS